MQFTLLRQNWQSKKMSRADNWPRASLRSTLCSPLFLLESCHPSPDLMWRKTYPKVSLILKEGIVARTRWGWRLLGEEGKTGWFVLPHEQQLHNPKATTVTLCGRVKQDLFPFSSLLASVTAIQKCQKTLAARTAEREVGKICQGIRNGRITDFFLFSPQLCVGVCMHVQGTERNQKKKNKKETLSSA